MAPILFAVALQLAMKSRICHVVRLGQNASLGEDQPPVVLNDKLFAIAAPDSSLIVSDGTASGTKILASHVVANGNSATVNGNKLYFLAADTGGKYELYETDGTTAGTRSLTSSVASQGNVQSVSGFAGSWVYFMLVSGSTYKPCRTNGTTTKIITTLNTGSQSPLAGRLQPLNASQNIFAVGTSQGARLYLTDNTAAGTKPLQSTLTYTGGLTVFNSVGYFLAITDSNTIESLYRTLARRRIGRKRRTPRVNRRF